MLSEAVARADLGYAGLLMGAEAFYAIGETRERYELVNGVVLLSPSPTPEHWSLVEEILFQIQTFARASGGFETYSETDLYVDGKTVFRPDLCVYARAHPRKAPRRLSTPPDIVIEINSPGNKSYDLVTKREAYEKFGVKEYWSIDPWDPNEPPGLRVRAWHLERGRLVDLVPERDKLASRAIVGLVLDLVPLRGMTQPE